MYISRIIINNIRSIEEIEWKIDIHQAPGWHVIIGDNGTGKTTFVRAVALAIVGPIEAAALRQDWNDWLRKGEDRGSIGLTLKSDSEHDVFSEDEHGGITTDTVLIVECNLVRRPFGISFGSGQSYVNPYQYVWGGGAGWFSAAYGPFRRFSGGDREDEKIFHSNPKLAAHLSIFGESVALAEVIRWLQDLQFKKLEGRPEGQLLDSIKRFVNQEGFLPHSARLEEVTSTNVRFADGNGCDVTVEELSDGYRSILSMTFELIRQMTRAYPQHRIFSEDCTQVEVPGVVLIDEIDAHLHPTWQRRIGLWFREHFPKIQFIVTTHSPLVCQAASVGTVWQFPHPGTDDTGGMVTGVELERLLYGNILDAYSTQMFGEDVTRSDESKKLLRRLAELNIAELTRDLDESERKEQDGLRATLPTSAHRFPVSTNGVK